ncbi:hypothetical protein SAMN05421493_10858 [Pseudobutyrivibrio sp. 49]|nr:hypothetical protein SAMN05421493_10858 [Pseudobutyrivibrio sp. 49]SFN66049.1 hypothetical protein SAMN04487831_102330 [Pseudobutyrivibrio sp. UC1225]
MKKLMRHTMMYMCMRRMLISQAANDGSGAMALCLAPVTE